jgi:uncharacterized delta-60 repeat protein
VADVTPPQVLWFGPTAGAVDVDPHTVVTVLFSEPIRDSSATAAAVTLSVPGGAQVLVSATVSGDIVTLAPAAPLAWGTTYDIAAGVGVTDLAGNALPGQVGCSFTTRAQPGSLDAAFAVSGLARIDLGGPNDTARSLAIRASDGRIALGGSTDGLGGARLVRLLADGSRDAGFGADGIVTPGAAFQCTSGVGYQSTGLLVAVMTGAGSGSTNTFETARLDDAGLLDPAFGTSGVARPDLGNLGDADNTCSTRMAVQPDDRIVLAGERSTTTGLIGPIMTVVRLTAAGDLDPSFGTSGVSALDLPDVRSNSRAVALQPDGKILVGGWSSWGGGVFDALVWRLDVDGQTDPSFGTTGLARIHVGAPGSDDFAVGVGVDDLGRVLVTVTSSGSGGYNSAVVRLDATGGLDPSFGAGGVVALAGPWWAGVAVQPDRRPVMAGTFESMVARFGTDGALDPVFGTNGVVTTGGPFPYAIGLQQDGKIVVVGEVSDAGAKDVGVLRLRP